jgi:hypothetical protein
MEGLATSLWVMVSVVVVGAVGVGELGGVMTLTHVEVPDEVAYIDHLHQHRVSVGEGAEWRDQTHPLYFRFDPSRRQRTAICERDNVLLIAMSPMRCRRDE